jgi:hypothetical protein
MIQLLARVERSLEFSRRDVDEVAALIVGRVVVTRTPNPISPGEGDD